MSQLVNQVFFVCAFFRKWLTTTCRNFELESVLGELESVLGELESDFGQLEFFLMS